MTFITFVGTTLIAFSPITSLLGLIVGKRPQSIIVFLTSAFTWILSLLIASLFFFIPFLQSSNGWWITCLINVIIQEAFRFLYIHYYFNAEKAIRSNERTKNVPLNDLSSSFAAGVGYGFIHSVIMFGSLVVNSTGPGSLYINNCSISVFFSSAFTTLAFSLLHVGLMIVSFEAYRNKHYIKLASVPLLHLAASFSTLANGTSAGCAASIPIIYVITLISILLATPSFIKSTQTL